MLIHTISPNTGQAIIYWINDGLVTRHWSMSKLIDSIHNNQCNLKEFRGLALLVVKARYSEKTG